MAGDWIKMRVDLQTHPKVFRMVSALRADRLRVIGGLHVAWSIFDTHSADGVLHGYTPDAMDAVIGWPGFTQAMIDVEWADIDEDGSLVMPRFDEHNGASAKRRANDSERKRESRKANSVRNSSASGADKTRTREEKRREDKEQDQKTSSSGDDADLFARFWKLFPRKVGKANAEKAWAKLKVDADLFDRMATSLAAWSVSADWTKDGGQFIPHPATWLNGKRWDDELPPAGNVHQFPPRRQANGPDFSDTSWADDLGDL
ncbi:Pyocin large subunit-like protein [Pseudomonas sp. DCB_CB]|uniref:Pyocin large subunit-like protein n=1 Tax=unclassified Pseudomonas TaxID=196821 RepID=UPI0022487F9F|nr:MULTISPECIES: Pyocin large subunit-like protein [unclassified Pseudomonas]MCX2693684.1 Pyocin large subunit-like protein [Pseudomonas sp. DCB_BZ]MCX2858814.1 Pyocin large subunit-like protein [Pseudomonas sp. DCB_CB]